MLFRSTWAAASDLRHSFRAASNQTTGAAPARAQAGFHRWKWQATAKKSAATSEIVRRTSNRRYIARYGATSTIRRGRSSAFGPKSPAKPNKLAIKGWPSWMIIAPARREARTPGGEHTTRTTRNARAEERGGGNAGVRRRRYR